MGLLKKGYEVLYLTEAVDEYAISALPEFEGKKFQNVAKEGVDIDGDAGAAAKRKEELKERFEPLTKWLAEDALKEHILKAEMSERLESSPCALITSRFGWTANMQRIITSQTHAKQQDMQRDYYLNQKKAIEINPRHPLVKELLRRIENMMRETLGVSKDETVEEEEDLPEDEEADEEEGEEEEEDDDEQVAEEETIDDEDSQTKDEL